MPQRVDPLSQAAPIADDKGRPSPFFIRQWQNLLTLVATVATDAAAIAANTAAIVALNARTITAGVGLSGGGNLSANRTIDLEDTAVTPATYGDSTHVARITVDQQGRVTAASDVAIAGGTDGTGAALAVAILADTPTAYWKCDETSGNVLDYGGGSFNLTLGGTNTQAATRLFPNSTEKYLFLGATGGNASLTGSAGSVLGVSSPLTGDWTVEALAACEGTSAVNNPFFSIDGGASETQANNCQIQFGFTSAGGYRTRWENGSGTDVNTDAPFQPTRLAGVPTHWCVVKDGTANTLSFYMNGVRLRTAVSYGSDEPDGGSGTMIAYIGANGETVAANMVIGHVAFYNGVKLSDSRIFAHAQAAGVI